MEELTSVAGESTVLSAQIAPPASVSAWSSIRGMLGDIVAVFFIVAAISFALSSMEGALTTHFAQDTGFWHRMFGTQTARAAEVGTLQAMQVTISGRGQLAMNPGDTKSVSVGFQNIGTATWMNAGAGFISVYTYDPKYRVSAFADSSWYGSDQPAKMTETNIAPSGVGHITFALHAPSKPGTYTETFQLASEDAAWIPGGKFSLTIVVGGTASSVSTPAPAAPPTPTITPAPAAVVPPAVTNPGTSLTSSDGYAALVLLKSAKTISAKGGDTISFTAGIKNTGTKSWTQRSIRLPGVSMASGASDFLSPSWLTSTTLVAKTDTAVAPGSLDFLTFSFKAPSKVGKYTASFVLAADGVAVPGGQIDIPMDVTSDAPQVKNAPVIHPLPNASTNPSVAEAQLIDQPTMRVGVMTVDDETDNEVKITCDTDFNLKDGDGHLLAEMTKGQVVEAFYKNSRYYFDRNKGLEKTNSFIRFEPASTDAICTVTNFDRRVTRHAAYADNTFRDVLEIHHNTTDNKTWLINELPIEMYLRGLGETSNDSALDFQKALITAARTYALYHWERGTKHAAEYFTVDAYADQVYDGYGQEQRTPNLTRAVTETTGVVVTYDGATAITPYFSRSDGRTRSWSEVWAGDVAWLKSVPAPCDKGKTLWGHGVGMSASQALCMANDGQNWQSILKYFYTGIDLTKRWN